MPRRRGEKCGWVQNRLGRTLVLTAVGAFEATAPWHINRAIAAISRSRARVLLIDLSKATFAHDGFDAQIMLESLYDAGLNAFRIGVVANGNAALSLHSNHVVPRVYPTRARALTDRRWWRWSSRLVPDNPDPPSRRLAFHSWCAHCGASHPRMRVL